MKLSRSLVSLSVVLIAMVALFMTLPFGMQQLGAVPTPALTEITNTASLTWGAGLSTNVSYITTAVGTNYGGVWIGTNSTNINPGQHVYNQTKFINNGNLAAQYTFSFSEVHAAAQWGTWLYEYSNTTTFAHGASLTATVPPASQITYMWFHVFVPGNEVNASYARFICKATGPDVTSIATNYTGFNGTAYGGNMAKFMAGYGVVQLTNFAGETNWQVTVQAAQMFLSKTLLMSNSGPFVAITDRPFPGGILIWTLNYSNGGAAGATGVKIVDTFNTNFVTLNGTSLKSNLYAAAYPWAGAAFTLTSNESDNDPGAATNHNVVIFAPFGISTNGGPVAVAGKGSFYYINYVQ